MPPLIIPASQQKQDALRLFGYSFLALFFELALIRYIPANAQITSYFINLVLIAAFLGLGAGMILQSRGKRTSFLLGPAFLILMAVCRYFANAEILAPVSDSEFLWAIRYDLPPTVHQWGMTPAIILIFAATAVFFIPLGSAIGSAFEHFPALTAYTINIAGSLAGLIAFAALSHFSIGPLLWFPLGSFIAAALGWRAFGRLTGGVCLALALWIVFWGGAEKDEVWSPYYKINFFNKQVVKSVNVNGSLHQYMVDFSRKDSDSYPQKVHEDFTKPYAWARNLGEILILGAGTGNDVAIALEKNVGHIDAVEIDPEILRLGQKLHFQKPYDDPRVSVYVNDARAFLKRSDKKYDVIILGTLDSQTLLSGMSSLRLDNYVYTIESFRLIKEHLQPGGILILYHMSPGPEITFKIYGALLKSFGEPPLLHHEKRHRLFNNTFVAGKNLEEKSGFSRLIDRPVKSGEIEGFIPTDDWPYLYLKEPGVPEHYLTVGGAIALFSLLLTGFAMGREGAGKPDGTLFFMGGGFMLLETKSVTEMSLLFGSTWQVNVLVFFSILLLTLAANLTAMTFSVPQEDKLFSALFVLIVASYFIPAESLLALPLAGQWLAGGLMAALPVFFSALIFAEIFKARERPVRSLGYNLAGAILGGLLEYGSMAFGTKSLYLISLAMYFLAYGFRQRENR